MIQQSAVYEKPFRRKKLFVSYAHADENAKNFLLLALSQLEHEGRIRPWHDRKIVAGDEWDRAIRTKLAGSDVILFLISPAFLKSRYCRLEAKLALERAKAKKKVVIPVILVECEWKTKRFARFQALPKDGIPITQPNGVLNADLMQNVLDGLRLALLGLLKTDSHGAIVGATSAIGDDDQSSPPGNSDTFLAASDAYQPSLLKALKLRHNDPDAVQHLVDTGHSGLKGNELIQEQSKQVDMFSELLTVTEDNLWVNLSPFETDRMLPATLSGTTLGRGLLETDCILKALSASLLHPDCDSGKAYWKEVYSRAKIALGTSQLPFTTFHKVWILADKASVFEGNGGPELSQQLSSTGIADWAAEPGTTLAVIVDSHYDALCESDFVAMRHAQQGTATKRQLFKDGILDQANEIAVQTFRDVIIPVIVKELNDGRHFAIARQIFNCIILASWFKKAALQIPSFAARYGPVINSNRPGQINACIDEMVELPSTRSKNPTMDGLSVVDHPFASDPAFRIPENVEFYQRYIKLFREGVFHVARTESGDKSDQRVNRVYFSGAVDLRGLVVAVHSKTAERDRRLLSPLHAK